MKKKQKNIGLGLEMPKEECTDMKCPFHGNINVKPETFIGKVIRMDTSRSATIEWVSTVYFKKYERSAQKRNRLRVHNPPCLKIEVGDEIMAARTRPLSKTKNFVIVKVIKKNESS